MSRYIQRRLISSVPVILGVTLITFSLLHLIPGDPVMVLYGRGQLVASGETLDALREKLGFNDPLYVQYGRFLLGAIRGDLGRSLQTNRPVVQEIMDQLPSTLQLTGASMLIAIVVGTLLGIVSGWKHNQWIDNASMLLALLGISIPSFWLGYLMVLTFSLRLGWLPATGYGGLDRLILPAATLGLTEAALIARLVRSSLIEVLQENYVVTARAKGLSERVVLTRHALRNAILPVITLIGLQFGYLLGGAVVIESVFARQGIGRLAVDGIIYKDFPLVQGCILYMAMGIILVNMLMDILYAYVDPRIQND